MRLDLRGEAPCGVLLEARFGHLFLGEAFAISRPGDGLGPGFIAGKAACIIVRQATMMRSIVSRGDLSGIQGSP